VPSSPSNAGIKSYLNVDDLIASVVDLAVKRIRDGISSQHIYNLALTGGTTGTLITERLVAIWNCHPAEFTGLHIWWGDERFVPELSLERNSHLVVRDLRAQGAIQVHKPPSSDMNIDLEHAANAYGAAIAGTTMDLTLLGVGPDGHVASLFTGQWNIGEKREVIAVHDSPKPPPARITFSMAKINASQSVWLLAAGADKRNAIVEIFAKGVGIPAASVNGRAETLLFLDQAANPTQ
jgi:6-phosphogluconolactonase